VAIRSATPIAASVPPLAVVAALAASVITGVLFGMLPALRASRLDPVVALRHE
jgi:putative ABC transport system permease protein